jgi:hypothetical protein
MELRLTRTRSRGHGRRALPATAERPGLGWIIRVEASDSDSDTEGLVLVRIAGL